MFAFKAEVDFDGTYLAAKLKLNTRREVSCCRNTNNSSGRLVFSLYLSHTAAVGIKDIVLAVGRTSLTMPNRHSSVSRSGGMGMLEKNWLSLV